MRTIGFGGGRGFCRQQRAFHSGNALLAQALLTWLGHRPTAEALVGDPKTYMIALTANAQTDDRREAVLSAGLNGLLIKLSNHSIASISARR